jgi:hypothetical protein
MGLVQKSVSNLYLGVSQQEPSNRLEGQVEESVNMIHSVDKGVSRRNPTQLVGTVAIQEDNTFIHSYERGDGDEAYIISIGKQGVQVFDTEGVERQVNYEEDTLNYLDVGNNTPNTSFKALTVGDTTFIVNNTKICTLSEEKDGALNAHKLHPFYWVKRTFDNGSDQGYTYEVKVNGTKYTATGTNSLDISADIASKLGGSWNQYGSIVIGDTTVTSFTGSDSYGGQASLACWGSVQDIKDLPTTMSGAEQGRNIIVEVTGDPNNNYTNYWEKYENGNWIETVKPNLRNTIDNGSMPIKLISEADGTFTLKLIEYDKRKKGDLFSAPEPSFIGRKIKDIFFFKNRLCFIAGENVIMSETGSYYNFFPTTVTDVLESDPIDVAVDSNSVALLNHAVPFDDKVILSSTDGQFSLQSDRVLSPTDVSISSTTSYNSLRKVSPINIGDVMYFLSESTKGISLREFYVRDNTDSATAIDLSGHVSSYVPQNIINMQGNTNQNIIFIMSEDTPDTIYIYKFYNDAQERIQTAWSKWIFKGVIHNFTILSNYLYILIDRGQGIQLERLDYSNKEATSYLDNGSIVYDSYIKLSTLYLRDGNGNLIQNARSPLMYKTIQLESTDDSKYKIDIYNKIQNKDNKKILHRQVANYGVKDNKWTVRGKNENVDMEIHSVEGEPLEFHTYTIEANYNSRAQIL